MCLPFRKCVRVTTTTGKVSAVGYGLFGPGCPWQGPAVTIGTLDIGVFGVRANMGDGWWVKDCFNMLGLVGLTRCWPT